MTSSQRAVAYPPKLSRITEPSGASWRAADHALGHNDDASRSAQARALQGIGAKPQQPRALHAMLLHDTHNHNAPHSRHLHQDDLDDGPQNKSRTPTPTPTSVKTNSARLQPASACPPFSVLHVLSVVSVVAVLVSTCSVIFLPCPLESAPGAVFFFLSFLSFLSGLLVLLALPNAFLSLRAFSLSVHVLAWMYFVLVFYVSRGARWRPRNMLRCLLFCWPF